MDSARISVVSGAVRAEQTVHSGLQGQVEAVDGQVAAGSDPQLSRVDEPGMKGGVPSAALTGRMSLPCDGGSVATGQAAEVRSGERGGRGKGHGGRHPEGVAARL